MDGFGADGFEILGGVEVVLEDAGADKVPASRLRSAKRLNCLIVCLIESVGGSHHALGDSNGDDSVEEMGILCETAFYFSAH